MKLFGFNVLSESALKEQVDQKMRTEMNIDSPLSDYGASLFQIGKYHVWELIGKLRNVQTNAKNKYAEYEGMTSDSVIQTALEFYADDSTQVDNYSNKIVMIKSEDKLLEKDLNAFLSSISIDRRVWNWAYNIAEYGDWFTRIKIDKDTNELLLDDDTKPSLFMDLYENGKRVGFAEEDKSDYRMMKRKTNPQNMALIIHEPDSLVHFMIHKTSRYDRVDIPIPEQTDEHGDQLIKRFTIVRGVSMLESVRSIYRILELLEDSLLAAQISKAEYIRIFNIEVGNATPATTTNIINRVKSMFDSKASFSTKSNNYQSVKSYRPLGDPVFNPTRDGKGSISHDVVGGDINIRDIADIDYFKNKLFGGLHIPAPYFGFTDELPGGLGDNTLTRLDIRYAHTIKRIQNALVGGIKDLCGIWLRYNNREYNPEDFNIVIKSASDAERLGEMTELQMKLSTINETIRSINDLYNDHHIDTAKIYKTMTNQYIDNPELVEVLSQEMDKVSDKLASSSTTDKEFNY